MHRRQFLCFAAVSFAAVSLSAAQPDAAKAKAIPARMQEIVDRQVVAGAVTLVAQGGKVVALDAVGYADLKTKRPMRTDDLFWIASMTKPITGVAVLMLQDEGKLSVDDAVEKFLPEFKGQMLLATKTPDATVLKKPGRRITLRDLLTHTAGLNSDVPETGRDLMLGERTLAYALQPLSFEPGSKWQYSNPGINTLGRIVEVVSGQNFADFLATGPAKVRPAAWPNPTSLDLTTRALPRWTTTSSRACPSPPVGARPFRPAGYTPRPATSRSFTR